MSSSSSGCLWPPDLVALELPEAMLRGDRAAERVDRVVHHAADLVAAPHQRARSRRCSGGCRRPRGRSSRWRSPPNRSCRLRPTRSMNSAILRHRHRDVVLDVGELRLRDGLADPPQLARLLAALRERGVAQCPLERTRQARSLRARAAQRDRRCRRARPARTRDAPRRAGPASRATCASTASTQLRETSSKARHALAEPLAQAASSSTAAPGLSSAIQAVAVALGRGKSRSTAAVMMPSVPSAPMNSCFRS